MHDQLERDKTIPGTYPFDGRLSRRGYRVNKLCDALNDPALREEFKADEEAVMVRFGLSEEHRKLIRERDWLGLIKAGGNIYYIMKIGFLVGEGLYPMGAKQLGITYEEFLETRGNKEAT